MENVSSAFLLTLFAGASTGIGSLLAIYEKKSSPGFLSASLGFSAGVLLYLSFAGIFPESLEVLEESMEGHLGAWVSVASFFTGILFVVLLDRLLSRANPHHGTLGDGGGDHPEGAQRPLTSGSHLQVPSASAERRPVESMNIARMGLFTAVVIAVHNFSEGLATFVGALHDLTFGFSIAVAIAIHNIPEGISIAGPIYAATGDRKRAFGISFLSGIAEPVGALIGFAILQSFFSPLFFGILLGNVSGIMVFLALDQLLPTARAYGQEHTAMYGMLAGMLLMAVSLLLLH